MNQIFPDGFYWGASTASYQVEGGIEQNDWAKAAREGKVPKAGNACDHWSRYEEDFDLAQSLGHNAHRLSIEWARIEPEEGKFDEEAIEHYREVLRALRARKLEPFVTIWHFTLPIWFSESGGFLRKDAPEIFSRYAAFVVERLGGEAQFWITLNEPMVYAGMGYLRGVWPPFSRAPLSYMKAVSALAASHIKAYLAIKEIQPEAQVGIAKHNIFFSSNKNPLNWMKCLCADWFWNHRFLRRISAHQDFIGLNHYRHRKFGESEAERASYQYSDFGWALHPTSLYECLRSLKRYGKPVYVTENGIADEKDAYRKEFIKKAVQCVHRAIEEGVHVRGYMHWSLLDNFEWAEGYRMRFGIVEVHFDTLERTIRSSARVYADIIKRNALTDSFL